LLRVLFADHGSRDDLRAALQATARQVDDLRVSTLSIAEDLVATGGPFPQRMHLIERLAAFYGEFLLLLHGWCEQTLAELDTWPDTRDVGLTPQSRKRLEQLMDRARQ